VRKIAIFGQAYTISAGKEIQTLVSALEKHKIVVFFEKEFYDLLVSNTILDKKYPTYTGFSELSSSFDCLLTMGGDGTILRSITYVRDLDIPIMGINTGRLGFLATIQKNQIEEAVNLLLKKEFTVQERTLLQIETKPEIEELSEVNFALNEITIARKNTTSMIGVKTYLNNEYLTNYWADGLIIATPTGSTGYSLSCGGPVMLPESQGLVVTPIAPHNLNARPMVIPDNLSIQLEVSAREKDYLITLDSRIVTVPIGTEIKIKKAPFTIKSILPKNQSYLKTLRGKLLWGEDTRNEAL
jgi:NAD+ kinase